MTALNNIAGRRFGRLTAIDIDHVDATQGAAWVCECDCGNTTVVNRGNLICGNTRSCGCLKDEVTTKRATTHGATSGHKRSPEYEIWGSMIQRCTNPNSRAYKNYGGRGIGVCEEWRDFSKFIADMGRRPTNKHSLDRIDNSKGYSKDNCRWVTPYEQSRNTRRNRMIETPCGAMLLCDASAKSGISQKVLWKRLNRGWSPEDLFKPLGTYTKTRQGKPITKE